jgi:hypothetical protein
VRSWSSSLRSFLPRPTSRSSPSIFSRVGKNKVYACGVEIAVNVWKCVVLSFETSYWRIFSTKPIYSTRFYEGEIDQNVTNLGFLEYIWSQHKPSSHTTLFDSSVLFSRKCIQCSEMKISFITTWHLLPWGHQRHHVHRTGGIFRKLNIGDVFVRDRKSGCNQILWDNGHRLWMYPETIRLKAQNNSSTPEPILIKSDF